MRAEVVKFEIAKAIRLGFLQFLPFMIKDHRFTTHTIFYTIMGCSHGPCNETLRVTVKILIIHARFCLVFRVKNFQALVLYDLNHFRILNMEHSQRSSRTGLDAS